jgi:glycosyltransferase involved in cell wall biosynthesis
MKILIISGDPRFKVYGGVEEHTTNLISSLRKIRNVDLVWLTFGSRNIVIKENDLVTYFIEKSENLIRLFTEKIYVFINIIIKVNPDIVHIQSTHPFYCLVALICQDKYPTLLTVHGLLEEEIKYWENSNFALKKVSQLCENFSLRRIKNIIVLSPQLKELINSKIGRNENLKTYIVPNGVNTESFKSVYSEINCDKIILFMGKLVNLKGVSNLIKAMAQVRDQHPEAKLLIAGTGPQDETLKRLVRNLRLDASVKFLGFIYGKSKIHLYKSASFFVLPSLWESLPIVILEAMASGIPIIASNVGGVPSIVNDGANGFLIEPGNINELKDKMLLLLNDKNLCDEMGRESLRRAQNFSWEKIALETYKIYNKLLL